MISEEDKTFILNNCITDKNKLNTWSGRESWWAKNHPKHIHLYYKLVSLTNSFSDTGDNRTWSCSIFCALNNVSTQPTCQSCNVNISYFKSTNRISKYCSECSNKGVEKSMKCSATHLSRDKESWNASIVAMKKTKLERYNDENYNNPNTVKQTCMTRYGVSNGAKTKLARAKISIATKGHAKDCIKGSNHHSYRRIGSSTMGVIASKVNMIHLLTKNTLTPQYVLANSLGISPSLFSNRMARYGLTQYLGGGSYAEKQLFDFVHGLNHSAIPNDRVLLNGKELDVYVADKKSAFELDGLYWHSEAKGKDKHYHLNKTEICQEVGVQLFHVFDNEWYDKPDIWKSVIANSLNLTPNRLYARKCVIKEVTTKDKNIFLNENHLQGSDIAKYSYGLYFDNCLVSIMTFCKSRYDKNVPWELSRFCNKINTCVVGGASRLLAHFVKLHKGNIVSYANRRWSNGNLYNAIGFDFIGKTSPNYFYTMDNKTLLSRIAFQKHKLKDKLDNFDASLTERQNMLNNGYNVVWDCGNLKFIYQN